MSGALSALSGMGAGSLGSATSVLGGVAGGLLGGAISVAAWRGVTFWMPNAQEESGRRLLQVWFPGRDDYRPQDFGAHDGPISVVGLIIGDDYVIRAKRMRDALMKPGPATLVHPWYGAIQCRLLQSGTLSFSDGEIRMARFQATFVRVPPQQTNTGLFGDIVDTLTGVLETADGLVDQGILVVRSVLSVVTLPLALVSSVSNVVSVAGGVWDSLAGSTAALPILNAAAQPLATLKAGVSAPTVNTGTAFADNLSNALVGVPAAIANAATPTTSAAIAPADAVANTNDASIGADAATKLLLNATVQLRADGEELVTRSTDQAAVRALVLGASVMTAAQAVAVASGLTYTSQSDAIIWRDKLLALLDGLIADIETLAATAGATVPISGMLNGLRDSKAAIVADISERLGRLPAIITVPVPRQMSAWLIAYAVAGENTADVEGVWTDMVVRNQLRQPAMAGPGIIKILKPSDLT